MRRDIGFFVPANIQQVYEAYLNAATHAPFDRTCDQSPYHTISFGVNYSMKYNMNGGSCHIHFMPCGNGTAVNMRFSLAQAFGARYELYAETLNKAMQAFLPVAVHPANYNMDDFLNPANQVTPGNLPTATPAPAAPQVAYAPTPAPAAPQVAYVPTPAPAAPQSHAEVRYCVHCGSALTPGALFCAQCGARLKVPSPKICANCQTPAPEDAAFCTQCGARL